MPDSIPAVVHSSYDRRNLAWFVDRLMQSLVFLGGEFSHAILKTPKSGDIRVQEEHGGVSALIEAPDWAINEASKILSMCPDGTAYARLDVVLFDDHLALMRRD